MDVRSAKECQRKDRVGLAEHNSRHERSPSFAPMM